MPDAVYFSLIGKNMSHFVNPECLPSQSAFAVTTHTGLLHKAAEPGVFCAVDLSSCVPCVKAPEKLPWDRGANERGITELATQRYSAQKWHHVLS